MTIREYGSRTAAANFLRGKGIAATDFNTFIKTKGDKFTVNDALIGAKAELKEAITAEAPAAKVAVPLPSNVVVIGTDLPREKTKRTAARPKRQSVKEMHFESATKAAGGKPSKQKPEAKKPAAPKGDKPLPVSQFCLSMFKAGSSNEEVWAQLQKVYGMDEDKAHYPSWYRSHFRRKGVLPAASAMAKGKKA